MSSVLRKKIEKASGLPPSVLGMHAFWQQLSGVLADWARTVYDVHAAPVIETRKAVDGKVAQPLLDAQFATYFSAAQSPGLVAITLDEPAAIHTAAMRLRQAADSLADTSTLFLKLMCEQPCTELWGRFAEGLPGHDTDGEESALGDAMSVMGGFEPSHRYLLAVFRLDIGDEPIRISLLMDLAYVQASAGEFRDKLKTESGTVSAHGRDLLRDRVRASTIELNAVLERLELTIGECSRLEVGQVLTLAGGNPEQLCLSADTVNGSVDIGEGQLGVWKQQRALKLSTPVLECFTRDLVNL